MAGNLPQAGVTLVAQDAAAFFSAMRQADQAVANFGDTTTKTGGRVSSFGQIAIGALREVGVIAVKAMAEAGKAVGAFVVDSVKSAGDFEQGLNMLQAVTGATNEQMKAIHDEAIALGNDMSLPATSAQDAAKAMTELAKAGLSVQDSMDAAKGTLQLATAAETDAGNAAQIVAGALNAFHLKGTDATKVADLLAAAANASSASMTDLAQGLQQGGFLFNATGQKIDDLTASLAILTNVGLTGSDAGTALKNAMTRLINPTDAAASAMESLGINVYDSNGKMLPFRDIIGVLNKALAGLTDQERNGVLSTIFLSDGMKAMIPLLDAGVTGFDAMKAKVNEAGAAQSLAGSQMKGFNGAIAAVTNAVDTLKLVIGEQLLPLLTPLINQIADGVSKVGAFAQTFFKLVPAIMASNNPLQTFYNALRVAAPQAQGVIDKIEGLTNTIQSLIKKIEPVIGVIVDLAAEFQGELPGAIDTSTSAFNDIWQTVQSVFSKVEPYIRTAMQAALNVVNAVLKQIGVFWQAHGEEIMKFVNETWPVVVDIITKALQLYYNIVAGVLQTIAEFINKHGEAIQSILSGAWKIISGIITAALALIRGITTAALDIMKGDWSGAWDAIKQMSATIVLALERVISGGLDVIAGIFGTSMEGIARTWQGNWNMLVEIAQKIPARVASVGGAIVQQIWDGVRRKWDEFIRWLNQKLQEVRDKLPFSEPKDTSSPLYGLSQAGAAIVGQIAQGIQGNSGLLFSTMEQSLQGITTAIQNLLAMPDPFEVLGDHAKDALSAIQDIAGEVQKVYQDMASMARQTVSNLQAMGQLDQGRIYANQQLAKIMQQANEIAKTDPEKARAFYQMEIQHVMETAQLYDERRKAQQELAAAQASMQHTAADLASFTPEQYAAEQERLRLAQEHLDILNQQYDAVQEAQRLERQAFQAGYTAPQTTGLANVAEALRQILTAKGVPGILNDPSGVVQMLYNLVTALQGITHRATGGPVSRGAPYLVGERGPELFMPWMNGLVSPLASPSQMAGPSYTTNSSSTVNYSPTYAQSPGSPAYDLAILGAFGV